MRGPPVKIAKFEPVKVWSWPFLAKNRFNIGAPREQTTLKRQDTQRKVTFLIENYKLIFHFSRWWYNRKCTFQDGGCRQLELQKTTAIS